MKVLPFPKIRPDDPVDEPTAVEPPGAALAGSDEGGGIDRITVRVITVAIVLSLFIHVVILLAPLMQQKTEPQSNLGSPLTARLEPADTRSKSQPTPSPKPVEEPPPPKASAKPRPAPTPRARLTTPNKASPLKVPPAEPTPTPPLPTPEVAPPEQPKQPPAEDMASYIESRRKARGAPPQEQGETDDERAKRIALGNIQAQQRRASPEMVDGGGGMFSLDRTGLNDADFVFHGWSTDFKRNVGLTVHVTKGDASDIKLAVVRRMIAIIRDRKSGDFQWYSPKRGKEVTMSARPGDTERLELFLLHEFYPEDPRGRDVR